MSIVVVENKQYPSKLAIGNLIHYCAKNTYYHHHFTDYEYYNPKYPTSLGLNFGHTGCIGYGVNDFCYSSITNSFLFYQKCMGYNEGEYKMIHLEITINQGRFSKKQDEFEKIRKNELLCINSVRISIIEYLANLGFPCVAFYHTGTKHYHIHICLVGFSVVTGKVLTNKQSFFHSLLVNLKKNYPYLKWHDKVIFNNYK